MRIFLCLRVIFALAFDSKLNRVDDGMDPAVQLQTRRSDREGMRDETAAKTTAAPQPEDVSAEKVHDLPGREHDDLRESMVQVADRSFDAGIPLTGETVSAVSDLSDVSFAGVLHAGLPGLEQSSFLHAMAKEETQPPAAAGAGGSTETQTVVVPHYFINLPVAIEFKPQAGGSTKIVMQGQGELPFTVPIEMVYAYPLVLFFVYTVVWCLCCRRSNRSGLSFRLICEAAACFMCLWADLATKHKVISTTRAWMYVFLMVFVLSTWNIFDMMVANGVMSNILDKQTVFWIFQPFVIVVWLFFTIERMFVRKYFRRSVDPMASDMTCSDCVASLCCAQFTALQEAQLMASMGNQTPGAEQREGNKSVAW